MLGYDAPDGRKFPLNTTEPDPVEYADTVAVAYDEERKRAVCLYSDKTLIAWDMRNPDKAGKLFEQRFHSDSVYEVDVSEDERRSMRVISGSSDKTLRDWTVETSNEGVKSV